MAENIETMPASAAPQTNGSADDAQGRLTNLIAKATALYGNKDYGAAAEVYSEATELQAEINGEMDEKNADLLYAYGRCLFFVAQKTSTVLGGTAAQAQLAKDQSKKISKKRKANGAPKEDEARESSTTGITETPAAADVIPESDLRDTEASTSKTPLFQITGDENWTDSEEEEEEQEGEGEEEEDDFANSFELLDLARILFLRRLDGMQASKAEEADKGKYVASIDLTPEVRDLKSRIADIYDLQAEISLEGEKFSAAVSDLKSCLALKEELESPDSSILAECHYKLSLALEAAAQDQQRDADGNPVGEITIDWNIRNEAVSQQEKAIDCCKLRVSNETEKIEAMEPGSEKDKTMAQIEDVQEMIGEMEVRLSELRKPPVSVKAETEQDAAKEMMAGIMGQILGAGGSKAEQKEELAKVMAGANDLSGMVKKKKQPTQASKPATTTTTMSNLLSADSPAPATSSRNGSVVSAGTKRKVGFVDDAQSQTQEKDEDLFSSSSSTKKVKVEEVPDSGN